MNAISFEGNSLSSTFYVKRPVTFRQSNSFNSYLKSDTFVLIRPLIRYSAEIKSMGGEIINYDNPSLEFPTVYGYIQ